MTAVEEWEARHGHPHGPCLATCVPWAAAQFTAIPRYPPIRVRHDAARQAELQALNIGGH